MLKSESKHDRIISGPSELNRAQHSTAMKHSKESVC